MLPLAKWIMQGPGQAFGFIVLSLISSPILWPNGILACAVIGLIWLHMDTKEGLLSLLWALLPSVLMVIYLDSFIPLLLVVTVSFASFVLKKTGSWSATLISLSACSMIAALSLESFATETLMIFVSSFDGFLNDLKLQLNAPEATVILPDSVSTVFIAGLFGSLVLIGSFVGLIIARSWQAKMVNPGGFQKEFHQLRLGFVEVFLVLLFTGIFFEMGAQYLTWIWLALFPMLIAGIALFHIAAWQKKISRHWYFIFYTVLVIWDPLKICLVGMAFADSFLNFRNKFLKPTTEQDS